MALSFFFDAKYLLTLLWNQIAVFLAETTFKTSLEERIVTKVVD